MEGALWADGSLVETNFGVDWEICGKTLVDCFDGLNDERELTEAVFEDEASLE